MLGRKILEDERVEFVDRDRTNLEPENLKVVKKGFGSIARDRAKLLAQKADIESRLAELEPKPLGSLKP